MIAPEPYLSACMAVIHGTVVRARAMSWSRNIDPAHLADLMDAIHNIPEMVQTWERCDVEFMRSAYFMAYDEKWSSHSGFSMCGTFDQALLQARGRLSNQEAS
jgi:hypothetical protein